MATRSLVILTALDTLRHPKTQSCDAARPALAVLADSGIPVVVVARDSAADAEAIVHDLDLRHPFICEEGQALYVPRAYFTELAGLGERAGEWDIIRFTDEREPDAALRLVIALYKANFEDAVVVGVGDSWNDRALLGEVDVPIIVRSEATDQQQLVRKMPAAYVTRAAGPDGWSEAILGSVVEGT
jgi:predicted mannosyl-3-phosphoglycerate phosphatase (HAD superfamily)